jgi:hypothetical protein
LAFLDAAVEDVPRFMRDAAERRGRYDAEAV